MSDPTVTLRLQADNRGLLPPVKQAQAAVDDLGKAAGASGRAGAVGLSNIGKAASTAERDVGRLGNTAKMALGSVAALASVSVAKQLAGSFLQAADRAGQLSARMQLATQSQQEYNYAMERSKQVAHNSYQSINQVAEIAIQAAEPMRQLGFSIKETLDLTEALSLSLVVSGASQQKSATAIDQFSKAMQTGVLRGMEFQSVLENAPRFVTALEQSLGKTRAELIAMARDGKLTIDTLSGVASQLSALRIETEAMPTTLDDAKTRFGNAWQDFAEGVNNTVNANQALVKVIEIAADNLGNMALAAGAVALVFVGRLANSLVDVTQKKLADIAASRAQAQAELQAARAAQVAAAGRLSAVRAGMGGTLSLAAAETQLAAAQARTTAASIAASNALRAKAAAVNVARGALAMLGGPLGLAVTAFTAFVFWARSSAEEAKRLGESVRTHFQSAMETFRGFNEETANTAFSGLAEANQTLEDAKKNVERLDRAYQTLIVRNASLREEGIIPFQSMVDAVEKVREELDKARLSREHLTGEEQRAVSVAADLVQRAAGIADASEDETRSLEDKLRALSNTGQTLDQLRPLLAKHYEATGNAAAANRLLAASFADIAQTAKRVDWGELDKALSQQLNAAELRRIELTGGRLARRRAELEAQLPTGHIDPAALAQRNAQIEAILKAESANERLADSARRATQAESEAKRAAEELQRTREQQAHSQAKYADEAGAYAAQLKGPIAEAEYQRAQRIKTLDAELEALNITQADHLALVDAARQAEAKRIAELREQQTAPRALLDTMTGELRLLAQTREQRELLTRQLHAEHEMREAITRSIEAGNTALRDAPDEQARLVQHARALAAASIEIERHTERVQEWADVATRGVAGIADVFTDVATRTIRTSRDMFSALKDVWKRGFSDLIRTALEQDIVRPFQQTLLRMFSGQGFAAAGQASGNYAQALAQGVAGQVTQQASGGIISGVVGRVRGLFGGSSAAKAAASGTAAAGFRQMVEINGQLVPVLTDQAGSVIGMGQAAMGVGLAQRGGLLTRGFSNGIPYAGAALGLGGLYYGLTHAGSGGLSAALGGLSYGALGLGLGGLLSGSAAALASGASLGGGAMAGMSGAFGALGSSAWVPIAGQIAAAAGILDKVTGGKLFGTKWKAKQGNTTLNIGATGGSASAQIYEERKKSFFRGTKRRWRDVDASAEAHDAARELYAAITAIARTGAQQLGVEMAARVTGSFKTSYDRHGNITEALSTVLGRTYKESIDAFQQRLSAENIIAQVGKLDATASAVANRWRANAETLLEGAQFMLTAATDVAHGLDLWSQQGLAALTKVVERMQIGDETLTATWQRLSNTALNYGQHIAGIDTDLRTRGLNAFQRAALDVERQYRDHVRTANELAKSLGLSGARAEDLAKIEQWRAVNMADVQRQLESERARLQADLSLSPYSPLTDQQKLSEAMAQLSSAVASGDLQQARSLSQTVLDVGRNLYASGRDYNALYAHVNGLLDTLGNGLNLDMDDGTTMGDLAGILDSLPNNIAKAIFEQLYAPPAAPPVSVPNTGAALNAEALQTWKNIETYLRDIRNSGNESLYRNIEKALA